MILAINDEVARIGWNKTKCVAYIIKHYGKISRLVMSDEQLVDLLNRLSSLPSKTTTTEKLSSRKKQSRRRRK